MDAKLFSLFLLLLSSLFSLSSSAFCNSIDKKALLKFKSDLNNPYVLSSWHPDTGCCDWYCVTCDLITHRINGLIIQNDGAVSGNIPASVGGIPYLETLILRKLPNISGEIPAAIGKLKRLKTVRLSYNSLSGSVPEFFSQLPDLEYLDLAFNKLSGTIPPSLAGLTKLTALHFEWNQLTGEIPESFGNFKGTVPQIFLSHNQLTGKIPESFKNMDFERLDLSRNRLVGDASVLFNETKTTWIVDISRNLLEFDLSPVRFPVKTLASLDISHNKIYGSIPAQITAVEMLQAFNASYNRLCGKIPTGGNMGRFDYSSFFHNKCLCGKPLEVNCPDLWVGMPGLLKKSVWELENVMV